MINSDVLCVVVVDDDGLTERHDVLKRYYQEKADNLQLALTFKVYTTMPPLSKFLGADIISWDNDLGLDDGTECSGDVIRILRSIQWRLPGTLESLFRPRKLHIVHSMNTVAADALMQLLKDLGAQAQRVPFSAMM